MKTRHSDISTKSQTIIYLLASKRRVTDIVKMGYPKSTVLYYKRKLFEPKKYESYLKRALIYKQKNGTIIR